MSKDTEYLNRLLKEEWCVQPIDLITARRLVEKWHYAKSATNTGVYTHGLFRKGNFLSCDCVGVAWWLPPTKNAAINTFPEGDWRKVLSLTRLVISPNFINEEGEKVPMPKNACSFLLSKSIKMIDKSKWDCLVTYADTWKEHTGTIYRATNWEYMGLTKASPVFVNNSGQMMGRKRGAKNLTKSELIGLGFEEKGKYQKHKFRKLLNPLP